MLSQVKITKDQRLFWLIIHVHKTILYKIVKASLLVQFDDVRLQRIVWIICLQN